MTTAYDYTLPALEGGTIDLGALRGKPVLIVNTASQCGFTPQFEGLQALWSFYRGSGLTVLGVPSNDFGNQEPGSSQQIATFCARNYSVTFPMATRSHVRGPETIPLFRWLGQEGGVLARPRWNFYKYLIGRDGTLANWFVSLTSPESRRMRLAIERAILDH